MYDYTELEEGSLGQYLRKSRIEQDVSMKELSARTGIASNSLCMYELNLHEPGIYNMCRICKALNLDMQKISDLVMRFDYENIG